MKIEIDQLIEAELIDLGYRSSGFAATERAVKGAPTVLVKRMLMRIYLAG
jgi:hypothetical protein